MRTSSGSRWTDSPGSSRRAATLRHKCRRDVGQRCRTQVDRQVRGLRHPVQTSVVPASRRQRALPFLGTEANQPRDGDQAQGRASARGGLSIRAGEWRGGDPMGGRKPSVGRTVIADLGLRQRTNPLAHATNRGLGSLHPLLGLPRPGGLRKSGGPAGTPAGPRRASSCRRRLLWS